MNITLGKVKAYNNNNNNNNKGFRVHKLKGFWDPVYKVQLWFVLVFVYVRLVELSKKKFVSQEILMSIFQIFLFTAHVPIGHPQIILQVKGVISL